MKKILSIALVALLAASTVFAGISGKAGFSAGYDLDDNLFSLSNSKSPENTFSFEFDASSGETAAVESGVYAEFSGSVSANMTEDGLSVKADLKDALIKSTDGLWSVNLTKVANGVEVSYADFVADVYYKNKLNWGASLSTPSFAIVEGLTVSANIGYDVALNDLTDPANWSTKVWKDGVEAAIAEARNTEEYFKQHNNGTYYNADLKAKQEAVASAQKELAEAKAKFAANQSETNYKALTKAEKNLADKEKALKNEIDKVEYQFRKDNAGADKWYEENVSYVASTSWIVGDTKIVDGPNADGTIINKVISNCKLASAVKGETYYLVSDTGDGLFIKASEYTATNGAIIYAFDAPNNGVVFVQKVSQSKKVVSYEENEAFCRKYSAVVSEGTKTVKGGLTLAYAKDLFSASVAGNVKYETIAKGFGFDVTAKAAYDFVSGKVSFERTADPKNILGAEVAATVAGVKVTVKASDILSQDDGAIVSAEASANIAGVDAKLSGAYNFGNNFHATGVGSLTVAGEVGYAFDFMTIKAKVSGGSEYEFDANGDYKTAKVTVAPELTLTNSTFVQNAELSLAWTGAKFGGTDPKKGAVTAKISVAF